MKKRKKLLSKPLLTMGSAKKITLVGLGLVAFAALFTCSRNVPIYEDDSVPFGDVQLVTPDLTTDESEDESDELTMAATPNEEILPESEFRYFNPLTGEPTEEDISRNRPLAIVLANSTDSLPMNGVSRADVLYEVPVEGNITRMLGIFQDFSGAGKTGSVRSLRHYTVQIAESHDAIVLASGGSEPAINELRSRNITNLLEGSHPAGHQFFTRDRGRIPGQTLQSYRSVITTGDLVTRLLPDLAERRDIRLLHDDDHEHAFLFSGEATPDGGSVANEVVVSFFGKNTTFVYNEDENLYYMYQYGREFIDVNNGEHISFANLIILETDITMLQGPYGVAGRRDMRTTGDGEGYFVHGGRFIEINWSRVESEQFEFTLQDDGSRLELGRGKTYIAIVPSIDGVDFS